MVFKKVAIGCCVSTFFERGQAKNSFRCKDERIAPISYCVGVFRCNHCTEHHIKDALEAGATREEIAETLLLASLQSAGTQLNWSKELFEKYLGD